MPAAADRGFTLLRSRERLRGFLQAHVPAAIYAEGQRYALPLSSQAQPPHLIVAADGSGVTCLAADMAVAAYTCTWDEVSRFLDDELRIFRAQIEANQLGTKDGRSALERVVTSPWLLSDEDMRALGLLAPLFVDVAKSSIIYASDGLDSIRTQKVSWTQSRAASFWQLYWGAAHWLMACAALPDALSWAYGLIVNAHDVHLSARALWVLVHDAERGLGITENLAAEHESLCAGACRFVLPAIAIRHPTRAKDAAKMARALLKSKPVAEPETVFESIVGLQDAPAAMANLGEALWATWPKKFQEAWLRNDIQKGVAVHRAPVEIETPQVADAWRSLLHDRKRPLLMVDDPYFPLLAAQVTRGALVPPYDEALPIRRRQGSAYVSDTLTPMIRNRFASPKPSRGAMPQVGRNELCPCGSGKKYKHCHAKSSSDRG